VECAYDLERVIKLEGSEYISAFIAEPISGSSLAAVVPHPKYFSIIRSICDEYNILLISEEVMTGFGRTGMNFGIDHWGVIPDIITTAKGISSGYAPLGAAICHEKIYNAILNGTGKFIPGITFAGSPLTCAAGLANLKYIEKYDLVNRARQMGEYLETKLSDLNDSPIVGEIRGKGLFIGIEFVEDKKSKRPFPSHLNLARKIADTAFANGLIVLPGTGGVDGILGDHILLAPPFIIEKSEIDSMVEILADVIREIK
jgi:adenosylmethionine-8-amino-7-oxononanoate aminotransferase